MEDFSNWIEDMNEEFDNDFLGLKKSELNDILTDNKIDKLWCQGEIQ